MPEQTGSKLTGGSATGTRPPLGRHPIRAAGHIQLTDRDIEILIWVTRHGVVSIAQIARRFFPTPQGLSAATQRVRKLCTMTPPMLRRELTYYKEPSVLRVTTHGARYADVGIGPARFVPNETRHALNIVDLTEELLAKHPEATLVTEREHRADRYRDKRAGNRKTTGRIPDAVFIVPATGSQKEKTFAVELDRSPRNRMDIESVIKAYLAERYTEVWWYVRPSRVETVRQVTRRMKVDDFIEVRSWQGS